MELVATRPMFQFPNAKAVRDGDSWGVERGDESRLVIPGDVQFQGDQEPIRLDSTLADLVTDLRLLAVQPDAQSRADHLAAHIAAFGDPEPCIHGRPMRHLGPGDSCRFWATTDQVVVWASYLEAIDLGLQAAWARRVPPRHVVDDLLAVLHPDFARVVVAEVADGLKPARARQVVELATTHLLREAALAPAMNWHRGRGPSLDLALEATAGLAIYQVANAGGRDVPVVRYRCAACGRPATRKRPPRAGEETYCGRSECTRERKRRNKARERAAERESS